MQTVMAHAANRIIYLSVHVEETDADGAREGDEGGLLNMASWLQ